VTRPVLSLAANGLTVTERNRRGVEDFEIFFLMTVSGATLQYPKRRESFGREINE
jgi:DNA-dependent RNA polymerase auxiliary subunit epsilon